MPSEEVIYHTYRQFAGTRDFGLSARDCLCMVDALFRAAFVAAGVPSRPASPIQEPSPAAQRRHCSSPRQVAGVRARMWRARSLSRSVSPAPSQAVPRGRIETCPREVPPASRSSSPLRRPVATLSCSSRSPVPAGCAGRESSSGALGPVARVACVMAAASQVSQPGGLAAGFQSTESLVSRVPSSKLSESQGTLRALSPDRICTPPRQWVNPTQLASPPASACGEPSTARGLFAPAAPTAVLRPEPFSNSVADLSSPETDRLPCAKALPTCARRPFVKQQLRSRCDMGR